MIRRISSKSPAAKFVFAVERRGATVYVVAQENADGTFTRSDGNGCTMIATADTILSLGFFRDRRRALAAARKEMLFK